MFVTALRGYARVSIRVKPLVFFLKDPSLLHKLKFLSTCLQRIKAVKVKAEINLLYDANISTAFCLVDNCSPI